MKYGGDPLKVLPYLVPISAIAYQVNLDVRYTLKASDPSEEVLLGEVAEVD
jgi:hypothetical protein